jgi:hydroxypyruvate isomerase
LANFTLSAPGGWFAPFASYPEQYRKAKEYGFAAIETLRWQGVDFAAAQEAMDETGVALSCVLFGSQDPEVTKALGAGIVRAEAKDAFCRMMEETIDAAKKLRCNNIVVTTGNAQDDLSREEQRSNVISALSAAAPLLSGTGIKIVLEPLNILVDHKGYFLTTTEETVSIIDEVASPDVLMLYDIYHQQITEGNIINNLRTHMSKIGHIHVADVPGRKEPGTGELNYANIFKAIDDTGYTGFVALECGMSTDLATVCQRMLSLVP